MNPVDPNAISTQLAAYWGGFGVILGLSLLANYMLASKLIQSFVDRIAENKESIKATLVAGLESTQALKDMRTTVDAVVSILKSGKS